MQVRETGFGVRIKVNKHLKRDFTYTRDIIMKSIVLKTYLFKVTITDLLQLYFTIYSKTLSSIYLYKNYFDCQSIITMVLYFGFNGLSKVYMLKALSHIVYGSFERWGESSGVTS